MNSVVLVESEENWRAIDGWCAEMRRYMLWGISWRKRNMERWQRCLGRERRRQKDSREWMSEGLGTVEGRNPNGRESKQTGLFLSLFFAYAQHRLGPD